MKIGAPYIFVEKLNERKKTDYDVHVSVMLDDSRKAVGFSDKPFKSEEGIAYYEMKIEKDKELSGVNLFHLKLEIRSKDVDIQHIRIEVPHEEMGMSHHHTGGSGSFEP